MTRAEVPRQRPGSTPSPGGRSPGPTAPKASGDPRRAWGPKNLKYLALGCLLLGLQVLAERALAEFWRVSPGPLNEGHAAYDHSEGCAECHETNHGVTNAKCLACHQAVSRKGGLHAGFGGRACIECHTEHKGRAYNIIDWAKVGGRETFDHQKTAFPLTHRHAQLGCAKCHAQRLKSGRTSYLGLSRECHACHRGVHGFTAAGAGPTLSRKCDECHQPGQSRRGLRLADWQAGHARYAGLDLSGKHTEQPCIKCHEQGRMGGRTTPRGCPDCHAPPHPVTAATAQCIDCHPQTGSFRGASIAHDDFGFPLRDQHRTLCRNCHVKGGRAIPVGEKPRTCAECHQPLHPVTRLTAGCARCHSAKTWRGAEFDHSRTGFALAGKHQELRCPACHRPQRKFTYQEGKCQSCHEHRNAHKGQYHDTPCAKCHLEGGQRKTPFDHNKDTRFPLHGFHAAARDKGCKQCHPDGLYRTGKTACVDCHQDHHGGQLGRDCGKCHTPLTRFAQMSSRHLEHEWFPLEGKHKVVACRDCHAQGRFDQGRRRCVDCHRKDDVHRGKLGEDCGKCHVPAPGAPKFDHDRMTPFRLTGGHRDVDCARCHQKPQAGAPPAPHPLSLAEWDKLGTPPLDRSFPTRGTRCGDCHVDPHQGGYGADCGQCHAGGTFRGIPPGMRRIEPENHGGSWLRRHAVLPEHDGEPGTEGRGCSACHGSPGCTHCHRTRPPENHTVLFRVKTHGSAASFDPGACRICHETGSCTQCHRRTRPLNHRGAWSTLHGYAAGGFANDNCSVCHERADCAACHR